MNAKGLFNMHEREFKLLAYYTSLKLSAVPEATLDLEHHDKQPGEVMYFGHAHAGLDWFQCPFSTKYKRSHTCHLLNFPSTDNFAQPNSIALIRFPIHLY